jgi:hypothetical protein
VKINDTPAGDTTLQFYPAIAVDPYDNIHVVWHDTRGRSRYWIGQYYAYSTNYGTTWSANERISDTVAYTNIFIGDYTACAASNRYVYALWCDCRNGQNNPDIYFSYRNNPIGIKEIKNIDSDQSPLRIFFTNPCKNKNEIIYSPADAELRIYRADGRKVEDISRPGVYFIVLKKGDDFLCKKLVKIR